MSGQSRKIIGALTARIHKSPRIVDALENASEKAQILQNTATEKYNTLVKQVHGGTATIIQDFREAALQPSRPVPKQLIDWFRWYEHLTGIEDVEVAKRQVIAVQDRLFKCQDKRRNLTNDVSQVAEKLKDVYGELIQTRRDDPKYVQLTIIENKSLQEQSKIMSTLRVLESEERDHFTELATAIKEYHDSQQMNAQKYKYLSILASAAIAIVSLGGSMIYNNRRIADVRNVIVDGQEKNEELFRNYFESVDASLKVIASDKVELRSILESRPREVVHSDVGGLADDGEDTGTHFYEKKVFIASAVFAVWYLLGRLSS